MKLETVIYEKRDGIASVILNRPQKLNAFNIQMRDDFYEVLTAVRDDPDVLVMILSGAGQAFCSGADLTEFGTAPSPVIALEVRQERDVYGAIKDFDRISIAAMHGHVFGAGLEFALFCDLRIAAEGTHFGLPETGWGFVPGGGATQSLPRIAQPGPARELILTGKRIDAAEAHRIGLVNRVVPQATLMAQAVQLARCVISNGSFSAALAKEALNKGMNLSLENGLGLEARLSELAFGTREAWQKLRASGAPSDEDSWTLS